MRPIDPFVSPRKRICASYPDVSLPRAERKEWKRREKKRELKLRRNSEEDALSHAVKSSEGECMIRRISMVNSWDV